MIGRSNSKKRASVATVAALTALVAGCARETEVLTSNSSVTPPPSAPVTEPAPTTAAPTTAAPTTAAPTTEPATVVDTTPPAPATSDPPAPVPAPSSPPPDELGPAPATAVTVDGFDLVERDVESGETVRVIAPNFVPEATYPIGFTLTADRSQLYFAEAVEDSWYACETSVGQLFVADLASAERTDLGPGWAPAINPAGSQLAYLQASQCLPDPEVPESWVITPYDTVIVVDIATGERTGYTVAESPTADDHPNALGWVGFDVDGSLLVATIAGQVHRVEPSNQTDIRSAPVVVDLPGITPVASVDGALIVTVAGDEGSVDVFRVDMALPTPQLLATSEYPITVGVSAVGHVIVAHDEGSPSPVVVAGPVTLLPVAGLYASIDW